MLTLVAIISAVVVEHRVGNELHQCEFEAMYGKPGVGLAGVCIAHALKRKCAAAANGDVTPHVGPGPTFRHIGRCLPMPVRSALVTWYS
jgi:hypothetical protein